MFGDMDGYLLCIGFEDVSVRHGRLQPPPRHWVQNLELEGNVGRLEASADLSQRTMVLPAQTPNPIWSDNRPKTPETGTECADLGSGLWERQHHNVSKRCRHGAKNHSCWAPSFLTVATTDSPTFFLMISTMSKLLLASPCPVLPSMPAWLVSSPHPGPTSAHPQP